MIYPVPPVLLPESEASTYDRCDSLNIAKKGGDELPNEERRGWMVRGHFEEYLHNG